MALPWLLLALIAAFALLFLVVAGGRYARMVRAKLADASGNAYAELAGRLGLGYLPKSDADFQKAWTKLPEVGRGGKVLHVVFGEIDGVGVTAFRHRMVVSTGQTTMVINTWVVAADTPDWPDVGVTKLPLLQRLAWRSLGVTDDEAFDKRWKVSTKNRPFARDLLGEPLRAIIQASGAKGRRWRAHAWRLFGAKLCLIVRSDLDASALSDAIDTLLAATRAVGAATEPLPFDEAPEPA